MTTARSVTLAQQVRLLIEHFEDSDDTITTVAARLGIAQTTLSKMLLGQGENPRLDTLRSLSRHYGITLDYFMCSTVEACEAFIGQVIDVSPLLQTIGQQAEQLSPLGLQNVLTAVSWIHSASQHSGKDQ